MRFKIGMVVIVFSYAVAAVSFLLIPISIKLAVPVYLLSWIILSIGMFLAGKKGMRNIKDFMINLIKPKKKTEEKK